jgi:hypothetical protein
MDPYTKQKKDRFTKTNKKDCATETEMERLVDE